MPSFSKRSKDRLDQCDIRLQHVLNDVVKYSDCTIITGHRTEEVQDEKYIAGESQVEWPNSKHNSLPSMAVDVSPYPVPDNWGADDWKDLVKFYELKAVVFFVAARRGVKIRWGGDWDMDGDYKDNTFDDLIHFEVVK